MNSLLIASLFAAFVAPSSAALPPENPFAAPSALPYGLPPFDKIQPEHFLPAFEAGMAEHRAEADAIAKSTAAPTFENTLVALERSGRLLSRVSRVFYNLNSANTSDALQKIEEEMAPRLTAHSDSISMDPGLFARIKKLYDSRKKLALDPVQAQLLERYYKGFARSGALLSEAGKEALKAVNKELSELTTKFDQNLMKGAKAKALVIEKKEELDGLSEEQIGAAAEAAKERGLEGKWVLTLQNTTIQPPLENLRNREVRERLFKASITRNVGGEFDNTALVPKITELRARQAKLLGYPSYAAYSLEDQGAKTPAAVAGILGQLGPAALLKAKSEAADIQKAMDAEARAAGRGAAELRAWDWAFYAQKARKERFDFTDAEVKPYFELERVVRDGVFRAATKLYGITFKERNDLPVYHPDVKVFEVFEEDGRPLGLLLRDDYKRENKDGGAWMEFYVDQNGLYGTKPVVVNCQNVPKPAPGQAALLTFDEVVTLYHEFGHALHGLFSDVKYPSLAGLNVPADFAEYPSQINEMFVRDPEMLGYFAKHYKTGEPMPEALLKKVLAAQTYGEGYGTSEYVAAAMIDQAWHALEPGGAPPASGVLGFELAALRKNGMDYAPVPPRYHTPYFAHAFSGGYQASYYAYIWAEVLARDSGAWFKRNGGYTRANGDRFRKLVLSRGRTSEPGELFEKFYGGKPEIGPLLEYRGLAADGDKGI